TDLQEAEGVVDSAELLRSDLIEVGQHDNDPAVVDTYVRHQLDTYHWLRGLGLQFSPSLEASSGQSVPRVHTVDPADMVRLLAARCAETGRVQVHMSTRAVRLRRQDETSPVSGVIAEGPDGQFIIESEH